ncbi:flagellar hook-basal body complex protein FliE [Gammaproteobacteria bacterium 45_16_T64]|nr:flagellar hook-basal body complex protein FliE [Gammaproteobacteria bacterium 45_16_T64]
MDVSTKMNSMLAQMKAMEQAASMDKAPNLGDNLKANTTGPQSEFASVFKNAIDTVNEIQKESGALSTGYVNGDPSIDITRVMVANQKAGLAFQSMVQVRNKLIESYKEVMNMSI